MGKRSSFARRERDAYDTPASAVGPLLRHLAPSATFIEPCGGNGSLVRLLEDAGLRCTYACDTAPRDPRVHQRSALDPWWQHELFITNPPWSRDFLHALIPNLTGEGQHAWLLIDAAWAYTHQAARYLKLCRKIVPIGRVKWIEGSEHSSLDDCAWYYFNREGEGTLFFGPEDPSDFNLEP